ncbi:MAG TPA: hypothetical protein PK954_12555, partial [Anaerolineales bacterium]|nr:hypothetical protein [Anaerolineales bacterium]
EDDEVNQIWNEDGTEVIGGRNGTTSAVYRLRTPDEVFNRFTSVELQGNLAQQLGINRSASITCVKPSGNSSQLLNCSSGLHSRWAPYYVRNVRVAAHSPLFKVLRDAGAPMDPENGQTTENANTWVVHFPVKAPEGAITRNQRSAVDQCEAPSRPRHASTTASAGSRVSGSKDVTVALRFSASIGMLSTAR